MIILARMDRKCFSAAFRTSLPVLFGYLAIGIAFGLMITDAGYPWWMSPVMSITMYAGAGQYMAAGLFAAGVPLGMIVITELLVNIRHIVYGLSLITKFNGCGKWKPYLVFALTDETYSLLTSTDVPEGMDSGSFYGTVALLDHIYWIAGGLIGAAAGAILPFSPDGVDFALTALFLVLTVDQIEKTKDYFPPAVGAAATVIPVILYRKGIIGESSNILIIALAAGIAVTAAARGSFMRNRRKEKIRGIQDGVQEKI